VYRIVDVGDHASLPGSMAVPSSTQVQRHQEGHGLANKRSLKEGPHDVTVRRKC
jgi:hypothetical protein